VLTEFRQGLPILDRVRSGALGQEAAVALLQPLVALTRAAHERGLVHGSIGPGNVIVQPDAATACLLDFGLVRLLDGSARQGLSPSADLAGWDALARALRAPPADPPRHTL
jgi:serine/threonine protein kinase